MDAISLVEAQPGTRHPLRRPSRLEDPPSCVLYDVLSFISVVSLLVLSVVTLVLEPWFGQESRAIVLTFYALQSAAFVSRVFHATAPQPLTQRLQTYAAVLVICSSRWTARAHSPRSVAVQKCSILLILWALYMYRDVCPLATDGHSPADEREGHLLWVKIVLLTFAAVILPLISPRRPASGVPVWDATVRAEQTASILSIVTYSWMNPFIKFSAKLHANKGKLEQDQLPHLPVERTVEHMIDASYKVRPLWIFPR